MGDYTVSGSIVLHNNIVTIKDTLRTLFEKTVGVDFKLYVINNLSTDNSVDFIKNNYRQIELIEPGTNRGFGAGHNEVLSRLTSKYHAIINPDIILEEDAITKMAKYMDQHEEIGLLSPKIVFPDGRPQILGKRNPEYKYLIASRIRNDEKPSRLLSEYAMLDKDLSNPVEIENATGCFMFIRTELLKRLGGFDENYFMYFEDCDLTRKVNQVSKAVYFPYASISHVWGRDSKKNVKLKIIQIQSMMYYFKKWKNK